MSLAKAPKPDELTQIDSSPPEKGWMDTPVQFRPGTWCYARPAKNLKASGMPNPREWQVSDARLETAAELEGDHPERVQGTVG